MVKSSKYDTNHLKDTHRYYFGGQMLSKIKPIVRIILIAALIICLVTIFYKEQVKTPTLSKELHTVSYQWFNPDDHTLETAINRPFKMINDNQSNSPFSINVEKKAPYYILKLYTPTTKFKEPILHIQGILGNHYSVYNSKLERLFSYHNATHLNNYSNMLNESFIRINTNWVYIVVETSDTLDRIGFYKKTSISDFNLLPTINFNFSETRHSFALFLVLFSLILFLMGFFIHTRVALKLTSSIALFTCLFGIWVFMDFTKHSLWIQETFDGYPLQILLFAFIISNNFMTPAFVKLNYHLIENAFYKRIIHFVFKFTLSFSIIGFAFETIKLFTWNPILLTLYNLNSNIINLTITFGSLLLLLIAVGEALSGHFKSIVYAIGLILCLTSFIISQSTDLLISHWGVLCLLISVAIILSKSFNESIEKNKKYLEQLIEKNQEMAYLNEELSATQTELLLRLGSTVDLRSKETSYHVQRVSEYTKTIATHLGFSDEEATLVSMASTLHDVGKVGIPDRILNQPGRLDPADYEIMKDHAKMGFEILNGSFVQMLDVAAIIALTHHERFDGNGYPNAIKGDDIPVYGAIVAAADVLDALLSKRVYKDAWEFDAVIDYFESERGKHFKPEVVDVILKNKADFKMIISKLPYDLNA